MNLYLLSTRGLTVNDVILFILGLGALTLGGNQFIKGAARAATALGISTLVVGLTVVALGTSAPELLVSLSAAVAGSSEIALGNIVGSNIANIGLILAISAIIAPIQLNWSIFKREIPAVIGFSILTLIFALDGEIGRVDGAILLFCFIAFTFFIYRQAERERAEILPEMESYEQEEHLTEKSNLLLEIARVIVGLIILLIGAQLLVDSAVNIARVLGVSDLIIGITLVAVGTSLPELTICVIASLRRENDIVLGNVLGSNISNLLVIIGIVALIQPITVPVNARNFDMPVMIVFAGALLLFVLRRTLSRRAAPVFILAYLAFIAVTLLSNPAAAP